MLIFIILLLLIVAALIILYVNEEHRKQAVQSLTIQDFMKPHDHSAIVESDEKKQTILPKNEAEDMNKQSDKDNNDDNDGGDDFGE